MPGLRASQPQAQAPDAQQATVHIAALSILVWALQFGGLLQFAYLQGPMWHAHEMLFGFTLAVLTGFLLTAGQNWSGQPTPKGAYLAAAVALAIPLYKARNRRNYFFVALLVLMALAQLVVHLNALGVLRVPGWAGISLGLDVMLFVLCVMGGRVIPGAKAVRSAWVEKLALGLVLLIIMADALHVSGTWFALLALLAMMAQLMRWWLWQPWKTLNFPLVWVLHVAYARIPLHLALRAMAGLMWSAAFALYTWRYWPILSRD